MTAISLRWKRPDPEHIWRLAAFGVAWLALAWAVLFLRMMIVFNGTVIGDSGCFWNAWHGPLYNATVSLTVSQFDYSPVAALALWPLAQLPYDAFLIVWIALACTAYVWLLAPLPLAARLPAMAAGILFSLNGNIEWILALVAVFGMRWPVLWLTALFTKVVPFVGFGWFVIRGEWRNVAWTAVFAVVLAVVSALILPAAWPQWFGFVGSLASQAQTTVVFSSLMPPIPLAVRGVGALALVWWGARNNRPAVLPLVLALCQPDWQPWAFGYLAAMPRLMAWPRAQDAAPTDKPAVAMAA
jgi:hypothetical protein